MDNWLNSEFEKIVNIENNSTLLSSQDFFYEKINLINKMYYSLNDKLKQNCLSSLKNNVVTNLVKENLSEDELSLLQRENIIYCKDFISLSILLNCYCILNLREYANEKIKN